MTRRARELIVPGAWTALAIGVAVEAIRLGLGGLQKPGPGFTLFASSIVLGALAMISAFQQTITEPIDDVSFTRGNVRKVIALVMALILYGLAFERVGFAISTVVMTAFVARIAGETRLHWLVTFSVATTTLTYLVLQVWLGTRLPDLPR